jgi:hypothetical protein
MWIKAAGALLATMGLANATTQVALTAAPLAAPLLGMAAPLDVEAPAAAARQTTALTPELTRRGYNACYMPETGFGRYSEWIRIGMGAQMVVPKTGGRTADGGYDVVVHFHGHEAVRRPFVEAVRGAVLVGIDFGISSGPNTNVFEDPTAFVRLLGLVTRGLQRATHSADSHIRHLALSSWSAGFGAVTKILSRESDLVDGLVLLDSLHSDYETAVRGHKVFGLKLAPVVAVAQRAVQRDAVLFLSHSSIIPPGYASTTEVADYLIEQVGGVRSGAAGTSQLGAKLVSRFDRQGMHVRGYAGGDKVAHCAHVDMLAEAVRDYLEPAWGTPEAGE